METLFLGRSIVPEILELEEDIVGKTRKVKKTNLMFKEPPDMNSTCGEDGCVSEKRNECSCIWVGLPPPKPPDIGTHAVTVATLKETEKATGRTISHRQDHITMEAKGKRPFPPPDSILAVKREEGPSTGIERWRTCSLIQKLLPPVPLPTKSQPLAAVITTRDCPGGRLSSLGREEAYSEQVGIGLEILVGNWVDLMGLAQFKGGVWVQFQITFHEFAGERLMSGEAYSAIENYCSSKASTQAKRLKAAMAKNNQSLDHEEVADEFQFHGVELWWADGKHISKSQSLSIYPITDAKRYYKLTFHKSNREMILGTYLNYGLEEDKAIKVRNRQRKLYTNSGSYWSHIVFEHPATFQTPAMDPEEKIIDALSTFSKAGEFYARYGRAGKREYLLKGPPGTGRSTLIAAMANLLGYDLYDLELIAVRDNTELRKLLIGISTKSDSNGLMQSVTNISNVVSPLVLHQWNPGGFVQRGCMLLKHFNFNAFEGGGDCWTATLFWLVVSAVKGSYIFTFTLHFSKGSSQIIAQYYQLIRLGQEGYQSIMENCRENAMVLKKHLKETRVLNILSKDNGVLVVAFPLKDRSQYEEFRI